MADPKKARNLGRAPQLGWVMASVNETDPFVVRALARGLSILCLFDVDHREWTIDEMAERTGLLRMTAYRMVRTLESMAFLRRDSTTNRYRLGPSAIAMAYVSEDHSDLVALAKPFLKALLEETGESVTLAVEVDDLPVCIDTINTSRPFQRQTAPGRIIGTMASVHGKLFAADKTPEQREQMLTMPVPKTTPYTVTDPLVLAKELEQIAEDGVAFDIEGLFVSTCAVGAAVRDQLGKVVATISVVVPTGRFGVPEREHCARAVKATAASLSAYLGWNPPAQSQPALETAAE